jgi:hypothetical protein
MAAPRLVLAFGRRLERSDATTVRVVLVDGRDHLGVVAAGLAVAQEFAHGRG